VGLIHVVSGIGGDLLMSTRGGVGIAIEGFQAGEEGACANMNGRGIVVWGGSGSGELAEGVDDLVPCCGGLLLHGPGRNRTGNDRGLVI